MNAMIKEIHRYSLDLQSTENHPIQPTWAGVVVTIAAMCKLEDPHNHHHPNQVDT
jgi:hypothetical protein